MLLEAGVLECGKHRLGAGRDAARVELDADPLGGVRRGPGGEVAEILAAERFHAAFSFRAFSPATWLASSEDLTCPQVRPSMTMAGAMPQQPMQRTVSKWTWRSAVV